MLEKATHFHGHTCGGLLIGVSAAHYAMELWKQKGRQRMKRSYVSLKMIHAA